MAQKLKEELRSKIIECAKEEFLENGFDHASMRAIAEKAGMTAGNLYRYFPSKEEICEEIIGPIRKELEEILEKKAILENGKEIRVFNIKVSTDNVMNVFDNMAACMSDIFEKDPSGFYITLTFVDTKEKLTLWFFDCIRRIICKNYNVQSYRTYVELLSFSYAKSICEGILQIYSVKNISRNDAENLLKIYLRSYASILDADIERCIKGCLK